MDDEPICPYCNQKYSDAWELKCEGRHEVECGWCEKTFIVDKIISVSYRSEPMEVENPSDKNRHDKELSTERGMKNG